MKLIKISDSEMEIMKIIWAQNEPIATTTILEELPKENSWKPTTVMTLLIFILPIGSFLKLPKFLDYKVPMLIETVN